jgi:hypothetical protein
MRAISVPILCLALTGGWALSSPVLAQQKTEKECRTEWQANKAANQAAKITEKAYVDQCRSAGVTAQPGTAPAVVKPAPTAAVPPPAKQTPAAIPIGANQYPLEASAKAHCPTDAVVWVNLKSKIYHFSGHKDYGTTKDGAYMCEKDASGQGIRAAKNEKHPT